MRMPHTQKTHDENRCRVCVICFRKCDRLLTDKHKLYIIHNVFAKFKEEEHTLPTGICSSCRVKIISTEGTNPQIMPPRQNYEQIVSDLHNIPPATRSSPVCMCKICRIAQSTLPSIGSKLELSTSAPRGRPPSHPSTEKITASSKVLCSYCFSEVGKGKPHICSKRNRVSNIQDVLTPNTKDQLTSNSLRQKISDNDSSVTVATGGKPMTVSIGNVVRRQLYFPIKHDTMLNMQKSLNLSDKKTLEAAKIIRQGSGSKTAIEPNLKPALVAHGQSLESYLCCSNLAFSQRLAQGQEEKFTRPVVMCLDVSKLIKTICEKRGTPPNPFLKIGIDGGGGSIKVCLNIVGKLEHNHLAAKKEPSCSAEKFLDTGVKKLIILGIAFDIPESYANVSTLMEALKVKHIQFMMAADLKLANILIGIQSHSSKHPCTWCEGIAPWTSPAQHRSLGRIKEMVQAFRSSGGQLQKAGEFMNCVHDPILQGEYTLPIIQLIPPPELHLMLGAVNKIYDELNRIWGDDLAYKFAAKHNITRIGYHGGSMEGNQCKMILSKVKLLMTELPPPLHKFGHALDALDCVRKSCFGVDLDDGYLVHIDKFQTAYLALNVSVTPKVHAIFQHVPEFCKQNNSGLGRFSEQASESVHADFKHTWQRYAVPLTHPKLGDQLLRATVKYNSLHI
jgi:hypothetical protein